MLLNAITTYYNVKEAATDAGLFSLTGVMSLITELNAGTFSEGAKAEGNTTMAIWTYLSIFTVIISRFSYVIIKVWEKYLEIKERTQKLELQKQKQDHEIRMDEAQIIGMRDIIKEIHDETFRKSNESKKETREESSSE